MRASLAKLGTFLRRGEFLARLDDLADPRQKTRHLRAALSVLVDRPGPASARLCLGLAQDPVFLSDDDRKPLLLEPLARTRPMSQATAALFSKTNGEGYFAFNAPLLVANGSQRALGLFEVMMADKAAAVERRVDSLHVSLVPNRTRRAVLMMARSLLRRDLEEPVATAAIESVFGFDGRWFGTHPPSHPAWRNARASALHAVLDLAAQARQRPGLRGDLRQAIDATAATARALLARRRD